MEFFSHYVTTLHAYWSQPFIWFLATIAYASGRQLWSEGAYIRYGLLVSVLTVYCLYDFTNLW